MVMKPFRMVGVLVRLLHQNSYMIRSMVVRDFLKRYVGSVLGVFWSVIHPATQLALYYFVFSVVLKMKLGPEYGGTHFAIWMIAGLLPWMMFAEVVNRSPDAVVEQASVIRKMVFPSEILPIVRLTAATVNHLIGVALLVGLLVVLGYGLPLTVFMIVPYFAVMAVFSLGIGWALAALNVYLRDIGQVVGVFVNIWFFLTPVVYVRELVPASLQGLYAWNPMLHVVEGYRAALLGRATDVTGLAYLAALGLVALTIGGMVFRKLKPQFADVL